MADVSKIVLTVLEKMFNAGGDEEEGPSIINIILTAAGSIGIILILLPIVFVASMMPLNFFDGSGKGGGPPGKGLVFSVEQWEDFIYKAASETGVEPALIKAVMTQESGGNPLSISPAGALGLMQCTKDKFGPGQNPFDPWTNIRAGAFYLRKQLNDFKGNIVFALAAYNAGPGAVQKYGGIPPYEETQDYVKKVTGYYQYYKEKGD